MSASMTTASHSSPSSSASSSSSASMADSTTTEFTMLMDSPFFTTMGHRMAALDQSQSDIFGALGPDYYHNESLWPSPNGTLTLPHAYQLQYLVNVTRDVPYEYAMWMFGYIMPVLLIVTIIANTLIVLVLSQRHMRNPTNLVLLCMAIADLLTLLFPAPWYFYMYTLGNHDKILYPVEACYAHYIMSEVIPAFFHTASIWLTLLLAGQRYIYVCHPTMARTWCTVPRVSKAIFIVFILAFLHQSTRFIDRQFEPVQFWYEGQVHWGCEFHTASWVKELLTETSYFSTYYGFRILFVNVGPCVALIVLNVCLFRALREAQQKREKLFSENRKSECKKMRDSNCTTMMLIVVVTAFLAVEIPLAITTSLHVIQNALDLNIASYEFLNTTILFTNFLIMASYPVNFAIYCGMSRQFRETFRDLFLCGGGRAGRGAEGSSRYSVANGPRTSTNETVL